MLKRITLNLFLCIAAFCYTNNTAEAVRQISWEDLIPADLVNVDPLAGLTEELKETVYWVIDALETMPERNSETEETYREIDAVMPSLKEAGVDINQLLIDHQRFLSEMVPELNQQRVRIPGYLLPLEMSGTHVTEFLLVPYVGACIHVPPPPPNQIIYVKTADKKGYKNQRLFYPVWVTGEIAVKSITKELFLVDGTGDVGIGYTLTASNIEPYEE